MDTIYSKCYNGVIMVGGFADADASDVTVTETDHTEQGHKIWSLLSYRCCGLLLFYWSSHRFKMYR